MANRISAEFIERGVLILTENVDGIMYQISAESIHDILDDWKGGCAFVPSNDAKVFFAAYGGGAVDPKRYTDFVSLIQHLDAIEKEGPSLTKPNPNPSE